MIEVNKYRGVGAQPFMDNTLPANLVLEYKYIRMYIRTGSQNACIYLHTHSYTAICINRHIHVHKHANKKCNANITSPNMVCCR